MTTIADLSSLHKVALADTREILRSVRPTDLRVPTPCAGWDLRTLLGHVIGQNHGFAAAVEQSEAPPEAYADRPPAPDGVFEAGVLGAWEESADRLTAAFAAAPTDRAVLLVEISDSMRFPLENVIGFQLLDTVVHNWDLATALGQDYRPAGELLPATLAQARQVPDGPARLAPTSAFAPSLPSPGGDEWALTLALLGRR